MTTNIEAMKCALDALDTCKVSDWSAGFDELLVEEAIEALRQAISEVEQVQPPPECVTENEKRAFAFGWFKALEKTR